jgi:hypothetical protein
MQPRPAPLGVVAEGFRAQIRQGEGGSRFMSGME